MRKNKFTLVSVSALLLITLFTAVLLFVGGCAKKGAGGGKSLPSDSESSSDKSVKALAEDLCEGTDAPAYEILSLDKDNFRDYSFASWIEGSEAACAEGQISISAFSMVLVRVPDGKSEMLAKEMAEKADLRKWICVEAEAGKIIYNENYVLMVMGTEKTCTGIHDNFLRTFGDSGIKTLNIKNAESQS